MKISIDELMNDCVSIQNQINGLQLLLSNKKSILSKYFDKSGKKQVSNDECTVFVSEKAKVNYDIDKLKERLDSDTFNKIVDKKYTIVDFVQFKKLMKAHGISPDELRSCMQISKEVDEKELSKLYDSNEISIKDLDGCYEAKVTKSIVLRLKNADREFKVK